MIPGSVCVHTSKKTLVRRKNSIFMAGSKKEKFLHSLGTIQIQ